MGVLSDVSGFFGSVGGFFNNVVSTVYTDVKSIFSGSKDIVVRTIDTVGSVGNNLVTTVGTLGGKTLDNAGNAINGVTSSVQGLFNSPLLLIAIGVGGYYLMQRGRKE